MEFLATCRHALRTPGGLSLTAGLGAGATGAAGMRINPIFYRGNMPAVTAVVQVLQKSILDALKRPEVQTRMSSLDLRFEGLTGAAAHEHMAALSARYARVVQATGMKVE